MFKKFTLVVLCLLFILIGFFGSSTQAQAEKEILFFYGQGCGHCAKVEAYFQDEGIYDKYPINAREVYFDRDNVLIYNQVLDDLGFPANERGVPTLVVGDQVLIGDAPIIDQFVALADEYLDQASTTVMVEAVDESAAEDIEATAADDDSKLSVPVVVGASLVDAINPCAFAVLLILLTTVMNKKSKRQALSTGLAFTVAIFVSYMLMGLGVYAALGTLETTDIITKIVGVMAVLLGLFNLKDYLWYGKFFKMEVPDAWRPNMKKLIGSITSPGGAIAVGLLVSLFLLPCTSGPYLVILGLLAENTLDAGAVFYLLLYNTIFVLPMLVITLLVYRGSSAEKIDYYRQANLERLHLIAGLILIALGIFVLI